MTDHLTNITLTCPVKQPTAEEVLDAWMADRQQYAPGAPIPKFTRLQLAYAKAELRPSAVWDHNDCLEVRAEG